MKSPLDPLWRAVGQQIEALQINRPGQEFPYILIDQLEIRDVLVEKDAEWFEGSFLVDVITAGESPGESIRIVEQVRDVLTEELVTVDGFTVQTLSPEVLTPVHDVENGVWRQLQRYRFSLTKNTKE